MWTQMEIKQSILMMNKERKLQRRWEVILARTHSTVLNSGYSLSCDKTAGQNSSKRILTKNLVKKIQMNQLVSITDNNHPNKEHNQITKKMKPKKLLGLFQIGAGKLSSKNTEIRRNRTDSLLKLEEFLQKRPAPGDSRVASLQ